MYVLMTVEKPSGTGLSDVSVESRESYVDVVISVMRESRRIVCNKNVDFREAGQQRLDFLLLKQKIAPRLVFPRTAEATKGETAKLKSSQVQVDDRLRKLSAGIVIALHR